MPEGDNYVVTGGWTYDWTNGRWPKLSRVVSYNIKGEATRLPSLQTSRCAHGCGFYYNNDQLVSFKLCIVDIDCILITQTYLVTGGQHSYFDESSTETLAKDGSQWVYAGPLPSARWGVRGARLGDKLIMTGELVVHVVTHDYLNNFTLARWLSKWRR